MRGSYPASSDPAPLFPKKCDIAAMAASPKSHQCRKEQHSARGRAVTSPHQVRLSPTDILKQLPGPMLPDRSLTALERQLSLRRERLELAMARRTKQHLIPRTPLQPPSLVRLQALAEQVETFPVRRRLL